MSVEKGMDCSNILTVNNIQKFARRQQSYMLAYLCIDVLSADMNCISELASNQHDVLPSIPCSLVEWVVKTLKKRNKSHHNVLDQETTFLQSVQENAAVFIDTRIDIAKKELADYH